MVAFILFFAHLWSFKVVYFRSQKEFNLCISILQLNSLSVALHFVKEEPNVCILYYGYLATNLLFFINTLLCAAMVTKLAMYILQKYVYVQLIVI